MTNNIAATYAIPAIPIPYKPTANAATGATATGATGSSSTSSGTADIGSTFLSLLVKELQNQDPTAPMDSTAMVGQMISLNELEQLTSINQAVGGTSTLSGAPQSTSAAANAALSAVNASPLSMSTAAATNQLPFDPSTMMPTTTGVDNAAALAASIDSPLNAASMGFSGISNNISGGK